MVHALHIIFTNFLPQFSTSCNAKAKSVECHLHAPMCSVSVVTVVFIHTMEDDQRPNTLVYESDALRFNVTLEA